MRLITAPARDEPVSPPPEGWENVNGVEPRATALEGAELAQIPYPDPEWVETRSPDQ